MTDVVGEQQRARKAIASMRSAGILAATDETERFEITSVVEVVLSLQRVKELAATLGRINAPGASGVSMEAPGGDTDIKDDADRELVEGDSAE
jgi:hypothetical protein